MAWTDAIRDVDSCREATVFLTIDQALRAVNPSGFRSIVMGSDSEQ
ncbi:hypothetical protein LWU22_001033 [Salmonella enterica]|nr:hypothetical protein [Salmonella enterica]EIR2802327.1 hypothetical protein [Salmonella enterica]